MSQAQSAPDNLSLVKQALLAVEQMKARLDAAERREREPIAIVGIGCRFPGRADSPDHFWRLLREGVNTVSRVPADRWDADAYYSPNPEAAGKSYTPFGAFIDGIDLFDAPFFNIAPVEAISMDPQQRLLLEVSWEALEHAGLAADALAGSRTGVFVGICNSDYMMYTLASGEPERIDAFAGTGAAASVAAGRLSYFYGFHGPNLPVDTACSSSLVALHLACQSLRQGECDLALAAGVSAMLSPDVHVYFAKTRALSSQRTCRTFDARADGYVRGEGCGVVVLKRLSDALTDGDPVLAVVRGTAVNHDGRTSGLTAPNGPAQQVVISRALANGHTRPAEISYVETHGTGTPLGDPIEVQALANVLGEGHSAAHPIWLGSVKTNIGHLEGAAGIAGVIKTALMLHHGRLVPHLHFEQPNPYIPWDELPVKVITADQPWPAGAPRVAGISSFGFSGTNAHAVLAAPDAAAIPESREPAASRAIHVLPLSARQPTALKALAGRYAAWLAERLAGPEDDDRSGTLLADLCHTAAVGRAKLPHRLAVLGRTTAEMQANLAAYAGTERAGSAAIPLSGMVTGRATTRSAGSQSASAVVFLFTGQGAQYPEMGRHLFQQEIVFRQAMEECDTLLRPHLPRSLLDVIYPSGRPGAVHPGSLNGSPPRPAVDVAPSSAPNSAIHQTLYTQPALFAFEYAMARLWSSWGIEPAALIGHSIGEYVAACLAGAISLVDALTLVAARGRLMNELPPNGAMLAAFAPPEEVMPFLAGQPLLDLAAVNGPDNVVISGDQQAIREVAGRLDDAGIMTRALHVSHAFHSPLMAPILAEFRATAESLTFAAPQRPLVSNVTGQLLAAGQIPDAAYWTDHIRRPVLFHAGLQKLISLGYKLFLEIGPKPILSDLGRRYAPEAGQWIATCDQQDGPELLMTALATCFAHGAPVNWESIYPRDRHRRLRLPTYPFERKRYWPDVPPPAGLGRRPDKLDVAAGQTAPEDPNSELLLNTFVDVLE